MKPSPLPLHSPDRPPAQAAGKTLQFDERLQFEDQTRRPTWTQALANFVHTFTNASTGSPSDGLGGREGSESSASRSAYMGAARPGEGEKDGGDWVVDEVVVSGDLEGGNGAGGSKPGGTATGSERNSDSGGSVKDVEANKYGGDHRDDKGVWAFFRYRVWHNIKAFFDCTFETPEMEEDFQKQVWYSTKGIALAISLFLVLNWIMYLILNHSVTLYEMITYYGPFTLATLPVPILIATNVPRRRPIFFQIWLTCATWYCGMTEIIQIKQCGFYTHNECDGKDFLAMLYYNTAIPTLVLFTIATRFYTAIAQVISFILLNSMIIPNQTIFARNVVGFALFSIFVQALHYSREMTERRMFILNSQLKLAYRSQQKAQIAESHANNSKRRFVSYIFHEVRVPLNTAMLAYQYLRSADVFKEAERESHTIEIHALEASLSMMQQVLDDVLDLQRMDSGRFESSLRPFPLHRAINSMLGNVRVATSAKNLGLIIDLDERIDQLQNGSMREKNLWIVGDEIRLRQVITNLASNATKFTPEHGGEIRVVTKLLSPLPSETDDKAAAVSDSPKRLTFRLEVHDNGPGISPSDMASSRLFTPFAQTNVGKFSSNKGSGLGLAIIKQIITLSGGRLGVQSRKGRGSCFWFELSYPIATEAEIRAEKEAATSPLPSPPSSLFALKRPAMDAPPQDSFMSSIFSQMKDPAESIHEANSYIPSPADESTNSESPGPSNPFSTLKKPPFLASSPLPRSSYTRPPLPRPPSSLRTTIEPASTSSSPIPSPAADSLRVLVVDDDPLTRTLMTRMLTRLGCDVETADDGQQCVNLLLGSETTGKPPQIFDMVSLDNAMPILSGEETVRRLRTAGRNDFVVGCTGNALKSDQTSYLSAGADHVLTKPLMLKDLKAMLQIAQQRRTDISGSSAPQPQSTRGAG